MAESPRTLVLGMGNRYLRDDAVGIRLAAFVRRRLGTLPGVSWVEECSVGGLNLLDLATGYRQLVIFDAIQAGGRPGGWYRFDARSLRPTQNLANVHDVNLATALDLGRRLGLRLPDDDQVHLFAVEVVDDRTFDERMSEPLERCFADCAEEILAEVAPLLGAPPGP